MTPEATVSDADDADDRGPDVAGNPHGSGAGRGDESDAGPRDPGPADPLESGEHSMAPAATERIATGRWRIGLAVALVTIGLGLLAESLPIFAASLVGLTYAAAGRLTPPPSPELDVERTLAPETPVPGSAPTVTVSVTNRGPRALPVVRIVDEPPDGVEPIDDPGMACSVRSGETASLRYRIRAKRGTHEFGDVRVLVSNAVDGERRLATYDVETTASYEETVADVSVVGQTSQHAGRIGSSDGGSGVEFHAIRAYQPTDPINRVDWNRLARTGELATIDFRQERAVRVVCVVDDRRRRYARVRRSGEADALSLSRTAAGAIAAALLADNNHVGVACFGGRGHYLHPGTGRVQAARIERVLDGDWDASFGRSGWLGRGLADVDRCCQDLADEKHLVLVSPLLDDEPVDAARRFAAYGHDVTVVAPAVTPETPGGRVEAIDRDCRLSTLRTDGIHVVDWSPDEPLHVAMDRATRRWSA